MKPHFRFNGGKWVCEFSAEGESFVWTTRGVGSTPAKAWKAWQHSCGGTPGWRP